MNNMNTQTETKVQMDQVADGQNGKITVLRLSGDMSSNSRDALMGSYEKASKAQPVLLDFTKTDYINSSGIALVIQVMMEAAKSGQKVAAFGLTPHFEKVFTMVGITKYAHLHKDQATAVASLG
jgi:anti-sigma B factor antagonist